MSSIGEFADDRLSTLPDDILSRILSLIPMKFVGQTSILSKRWRYNWALVTNLDFDDTNDHLFYGYSLEKFVDRVMEFHSKYTSQVKLFRLHFLESRVPKSSVSRWIDEAVKLNVRELDIEVICLMLPSSMFHCKMLTKLRLNCSRYECSDWECPSSCVVYLPCLKTLEIFVYRNPFVNAFKLIDGCPVLESLSLKVIRRNDKRDYVFNIPTLKQLKLKLPKNDLYDHTNKIVLNVPNLQFLFVGGRLRSSFEMEDVSSLVEATLLFSEVTYDNLLVELLNVISEVRSFSAKNISLHYLYPTISLSSWPIFPNMTHLELKDTLGFGLFFRFVERCHQLKHVCIENVTERDSWTKPKLVPACMLTNLATIKFLKCKGQKCDIQFLEYMLVNAHVLETLTISWENISFHVERRLRAQLLAVTKASRYCEIHFIGGPPSPPLIKWGSICRVDAVKTINHLY